MASRENQFEGTSVTTPLCGHGSHRQPRLVRYCEENSEFEAMMPNSSNTELKKEPTKSIGARTLVAFWILGLCNNYGYVVMLTAAHDILSDDHGHTPTNGTRHCNPVSTGAVLLADIMPSLLIKLIAPFFPLAIHFRMTLIVLLAAAGFIIVAEAPTQSVAIAGVVSTALSSGLGEVTLLSYMAFYKNKNVISTWSSGTGGAGFFGSFTYALLTNIFRMTRYSTLYSLLTVPAVMALSFWFLLEKPDGMTQAESIEDNNSKPPTTRSQSDDMNSVGDAVPLTASKESFLSKLHFLPSLLKYMIPMCFVYFFEYLINQGLFELVQFDIDWLSYSDQYKWYQVDYQIGVFISRSSINLMKINKTWLLALLQGFNVILFATQAIYRYIPYIYVILLAVFWEGLLGGAAYVNTYNRISNEVPIEKQEFSMAFTSLSDALGISLAGFLAIPVHNAICDLPI